MPSPRRSTRAAMPSTSKLSHGNSSSSSVTSAHPERPSRARRSSPSPVHPKLNSSAEDASDNEEEGGSEITRCVCGSQDYPGPPSTDDHKPQSEDSGNFFIQCDKCNVWQHGGCVGIMAEEDSPDNYSCELCEKRLHQLHTDDNGQSYSLYLPVTRRTMPNHRKPSVSKDHEKLKKERELLARMGIEWNGHKRRSTMNSRQNYDEEEMLRKAIEESKGDLEPSRKVKRGRDESEDTKPHIKRQRTGSESMEGTSTLPPGSADGDSDDDGAPQSKSAIKRARAAAAETQRQREMKEREKLKELQREEAAGRRKERAGRRRVDEMDDNDGAGESMPPPSRPTSPGPDTDAIQPNSSHKKTEKGKRPARNQYTKDREASPSKNGSSAGSGEDGAKKSGSGKQSPSSAAPPPSKGKNRSHKAKAAVAAAGTKADSSGSDSEKNRLPPPDFYLATVLRQEQDFLEWIPEMRERLTQWPDDVYFQESLQVTEAAYSECIAFKNQLLNLVQQKQNGTGIGLGVS